MSKTANHFQIIGGNHRGRKFNFVDAPGLRPTPNKVRETLFNWIQFESNNAVFLDLFAGSGALSFEALSRGAKQVVSIEKDFNAFQNLAKNQKILNLNNIEIINIDALNFLNKKPSKPFDFILLDPPFHKNILKKTLSQLSKTGFLTSGCQVYLESEFEITADFLSAEISQKIKINKQKCSGQVHYCLIEVL
ncbi:16S rRNA (guanine(966)-N(2))-methyltransferase RsmD [Candidatus Thioglobus sp.]|uniref:16S rRNA (guanine(966)-N(2))-methyltransferase RsmD n=1 Tax=Candidatus Thioglobus sp. TaxID=2026721 RepID=UPI003D0C5E52